MLNVAVPQHDRSFMLFAGLKRQAIGAVAAGINGYTHNPPAACCV